MTEITAKGQSGTVIFDGQFVTIRREGVLARMTVGKGEKRIPVASITAVQWKEPGALVNGYIAFTISGGVESRATAGRQTVDAARDENAVVVTKKQAPDFGIIRTAVDEAIAAHHAPQAPIIVSAAPAGAEEVARLVALHEAGHLTVEEFAAAKAKALGI